MPGAPWHWWLLRPCGTEAAYKRHQRHGEDPDPACREANRQASARKRHQSAAAVTGSAR